MANHPKVLQHYVIALFYLVPSTGDDKQTFAACNDNSNIDAWYIKRTGCTRQFIVAVNLAPIVEKLKLCLWDCLQDVQVF